MLPRIVRLLRKRPETGAILVTILLVVGFTSTTEGKWLTIGIMHEVLRVTSVLAIIAFGEALVITTGHIDISVGSIFGIVGIIYLQLGPQVGAPLAILIALLLAVVIGAVNGFIVSYFRVSSLVVTLGGLFVFRGLALAATQNPSFYSADSVMQANPAYQVFGATEVLGWNDALIWAAVVLLFLQYILFWTPFGNWLLAVGGNADSAHSRGVNVVYARWMAFVACAFFAGLAGILEASNLGYVDGSFGQQRELQAIAAAVLGGCALLGGRSSLVGTLFGAFILSGIQSYLILKAIHPEWFILLLGLIVVLVSLADRGLARLLIRLAHTEHTKRVPSSEIARN